jgi:hypothetical protein
VELRVPGRRRFGTFIVECPPEVWTGLGFDVMSASDGLALLEELFEHATVIVTGTPLGVCRPTGAGGLADLFFAD